LYLNKNLQSLVGEEFTTNNKKMYSTQKMHCFHLSEILFRMSEYYNNNKNVHLEFEVVRTKRQNNDIILDSKHYFNNFIMPQWKIKLNDINSFSFNEIGKLRLIDNLHVHYNDIINVIEKDSDINKKLSKFFFKQSKNSYLTQLHPLNIIGVIIQSIAIVKYENNPEKFLNAIQWLQKNDDEPFCVGQDKMGVLSSL
jgi:hypothetical protein